VPAPVGDFFSIGKPDPRCNVSVARHRELTAQYQRLLREVAQIAPGKVSIFDTVPYLCDMGGGMCGAFEGGEHLYSFSDHLSDYASTKVGRALNEHMLKHSPSSADELDSQRSVKARP
jgi:hypothetical protein